MTYKVEIKSEDKEVNLDLEDLKELKRILEEYESVEEVKAEKVLRIKLWKY